MSDLTRRFFLRTSAAFAAGSGPVAFAKSTGKPALLGGKPVRDERFPQWPVVKGNDEVALMEALQSKNWFRGWGNFVSDFEKAWARKLGAGHCLATSGGTTALYSSLNALEVGPKDEVIVPPYTFIATVNVVLLQHALPVFVDTDRETFQIDPGKIEAAITPRTRCILPVHLGGSAADMDKILAIAARHHIPVVEDACQAHLAEWKGKKVGTLGDLGCFSFQGSKNLNSGEGGAVVTSDAKLFARADSFHNNSRPIHDLDARNAPRAHGCNLRMTEFQGALLLSQMERLEEQCHTREQNASKLTELLQEIPGVSAARMYEGCTRNAYHLYMFRYDAEQFQGLSRARFLEALQAEGIPCSSGYKPLNKDPFLEHTFTSRAFRSIYSAAEIRALQERNACPANDRLCGEAVWLSQRMLLGDRRDMEQIAAAIEKVRRHAEALRKSQNS